MNSFDTLHSEMHHGFSILFYFWREVKGEASKGPKGFLLKTSTKLAKFLWNVFQLCRFKQIDFTLLSIVGFLFFFYLPPWPLAKFGWSVLSDDHQSTYFTKFMKKKPPYMGWVSVDIKNSLHLGCYLEEGINWKFTHLEIAKC